MWLTKEDLEISDYATSFLSCELRGFLDLTDLYQLSQAAKINKDFNFQYENRHHFNNKLLQITTKCTLKSTGETKYVVPVFVTKSPCANFYFEEEVSLFTKQNEAFPKHQRPSVDDQISKLNERQPWGIYFKGNDDISYGLRCVSEAELESYLTLGRDLGELDLMWRN